MTLRLSNDFVVRAPVAEAWAVLTDLDRVAACMPGAALEESDGNRYRGTVSVKIGPIGARYVGVAWFEHQDERERRATLRAEGDDTASQGRAAATVVARLHEEAPDLTRVVLETELDIAGRIAQFGRGAIADVSARLLDQFAENLARDLDRPSSNQAPPAHVRDDAPAPAALDMASVLGPVVLKRLIPAAALVAAFLLGRQTARMQRRRSWRDDQRGGVGQDASRRSLARSDA